MIRDRIGKIRNSLNQNQHQRLDPDRKVTLIAPDAMNHRRLRHLRIRNHMVAAEHHVEREVWPVRARKYGVDDRSPWWQRWYFKLIYLPFLRLSFKYMKIPAMKEVTIDGKKVIFSWWEDQGVFETKEQAEAACLGPMWSYKKLPLNRLLAKESSHYNGGDVYPRADKPERFAQPSFEVMTPRSINVRINKSVKRLSRILDDEE